MTNTLFHRIDIGAAVIGVLTIIAWGALSGVPAAASASVGVGLGLLNFVMLRWLMARAFDATRSEMRPAGAGLLGVKFLVLGLLLYVLIVVVRIDALPFVTGLSASVTAMVLLPLWAATTPARLEAPETEA